MSTRTPAPIAPEHVDPAYPGPYTVGLHDPENMTVQIIAADGAGVAIVEIDPLGSTAALLAAAPQLRDALASLLATLHAKGPDAWQQFTDAERAARALLATLPPTPGGSTDGR